MSKERVGAMKGDALLLISILLDIKNSVAILLKEKHKAPALINLYIFFDICASLARERKMGNGDTFKSYVQKCMTTKREYTPDELWSARCSVVHAFSLSGDSHAKAKGQERAFYYYHYPETKTLALQLMKEQGKSDYLPVDIDDLYHDAIWCFNELHRRIGEDSAFCEIFISNGRDIVKDSHYVALTRFLRSVDEMQNDTVPEGEMR